MLQALDRQETLTSNQIKLIAAGTFGVVLEFLDYFLIGFVLTFIAKPWQLTFGLSSVILLASGVGSMVGAAFFGWLSDAIGRRKVFLTTIAVFTVATGALVVTPESKDIGWIYLTVFRFLIGFGAGGLYCVDLPLIQEFVPTNKRGVVTGLVTSAVPFGFLIGSALVTLLAGTIGWRGLMGVCVVLALVTLLMRSWIPESPRWLVQNGRLEEARKAVAWALKVDPETLPLTAVVRQGPKPRLRELFRYPRSVAVSWISNLGTQTGYYGLTLWSPTLIVQFLQVPPQQAAFYMIFVTLAALAGRVVLSVLAERIGRRATGVLCGAGSAVMMVIAAFFGAAFAGVAALFLGMLMIAYFFGEGSMAVVGPYSGEVWPTTLRTSGMGAAYGFGGLGKTIGPLGLALIVGASASTAPAASVSYQAAFLFFAAWYVLSALSFVIFGIETRGRSIEEIEEQLEAQRSGISAAKAA
ncbi:MAG: MFS transporter [Alphaproteobacteria bacterium]|nr:MFS transporter [Alphaproteobacteria bacterium]